MPTGQLVFLKNTNLRKNLFFMQEMQKSRKNLNFSLKKFGGKEKMSTFAIPNEKKTFEKTNSRIAQLVRASDC